MASNLTFQFTASPHRGLVLLEGFLATDSSGLVTNSGTTKDQDGDFLLQPRGFSVAKHATQTGLYIITLSEAWVKLMAIEVQPQIPKNQAQATLLGTVDLTGVTMSTLTGKTLKLDGDVGALVTCTFTLPANVADIAAQINTAMAAGSSGVRAEIVTSSTGAQFLRCYSQTWGTTSTLTADATSNGATILGIATGTTPAGQALGQFDVLDFNERGVVFNNSAPLQVQVLYNASGVGLNLVSGGFWVYLVLRSE